MPTACPASIRPAPLTAAPLICAEPCTHSLPLAYTHTHLPSTLPPSAGMQATFNPLTGASTELLPSAAAAALGPGAAVPVPERGCCPACFHEHRCAGCFRNYRRSVRAHAHRRAARGMQAVPSSSLAGLVCLIRPSVRSACIDGVACIDDADKGTVQSCVFLESRADTGARACACMPTGDSEVLCPSTSRWLDLLARACTVKHTLLARACTVKHTRAHKIFPPARACSWLDLLASMLPFGKEHRSRPRQRTRHTIKCVHLCLVHEFCVRLLLPCASFLCEHSPTHKHHLCVPALEPHLRACLRTLMACPPVRHHHTCLPPHHAVGCAAPLFRRPTALLRCRLANGPEYASCRRRSHCHAGAQNALFLRPQSSRPAQNTTPGRHSARALHEY